jgi:hypothetical protein
MGFGDPVRHHANRRDLSWRGSHLVLAGIIARNLKVYVSRFGPDRRDSTFRTSGGNYMNVFKPGAELLKEIKEQAKFERDGLPPPEPGLPF